MNFKLSICDGKYTYVYENGQQHALRYDEPWRDLIGDKFIFSLAVELDEANKEIKSLVEKNGRLREELALEEQRIADLMADLNRVGHELADDAGVIVHDNLSHPNDEALVMRNPPKLGISTLCRLMDDCLPEQIDDARDMQKLIDKLWPALCCEFDADA